MNPMTKQRLAQYNSLKREIAMLEDQIYKAECGGEFVTDFAKDYKTGHPKVITLRGYGSDAVPKLSARITRCLAECKAIENYIDAIEDSILRQLFTWRFIEGKTMKDAAVLVGYSERQSIRIINEFLERCHPMSPDVT